MAITFPASPSNGDVFTNSTTGVKYIYNATDGVWKTHIWPTNTDYLQLSGGTLTGNLSLGTNDLTAQDITTTGSVTVGNGLTVSDGNLVMAAGHGIDFSADANAAGMTSELLDDYEEGTWTPIVARGTSNPTVTYNYQEGTYTKVGRIVTVFFDIETSLISGGAGGARITPLPFVVSSSMAGYSVIHWRASDAVASGGSGTQLAGFVQRGSTYIRIMYDNSGTSGYGSPGDSSWNSSGRVTGYVSYEV